MLNFKEEIQVEDMILKVGNLIDKYNNIRDILESLDEDLNNTFWELKQMLTNNDDEKNQIAEDIHEQYVLNSKTNSPEVKQDNSDNI